MLAHTVVVVTGTVVGTTVVVVVGVLAPSRPAREDGTVVLVVLVDVVVLAGAGVVTVAADSARDAAAKQVTMAAERTLAPTSSEPLNRRTRANRRSRCWGVRGEGVIGGSASPSLAAAP